MRDWIFVPPDFMSALGQYAYFIAQPFTSLWFITMLPIYFVVTRLTNGFSRPFMLVAATALFIFRLDTGVRLIDNFGKFYIFFLFGYFFAQQIFAIADWLFRRPVVAIVFLLAWLVSNIWVTKLFWSAWDDHLIMLLVAGIAGVLALIALSQLMAVAPGFQWLSYLGANSITVYLGFYIPMLFTGFVARRIHLDLHTNFSSILVWLFCISAPVLLHLLVRGTRLDFIFHRPRCFRLS